MLCMIFASLNANGQASENAAAEDYLTGRQISMPTTDYVTDDRTYYRWVVAEHIHGLWKIIAEDMGSAKYESGVKIITMIHLKSFRTGVTWGDYEEVSAYEYGSRMVRDGYKVTVIGKITITIAGVPAIGRTFGGLHTYR